MIHFRINHNKFFLALICTILCLHVFGQTSKFDSLKQLLPKTTTPEKRAILCIDIARSIYNTIPDSSIGYCQAAGELSKNII